MHIVSRPVSPNPASPSNDTRANGDDTNSLSQVINSQQRTRPRIVGTQPPMSTARAHKFNDFGQIRAFNGNKHLDSLGLGLKPVKGESTDKATARAQLNEWVLQAKTTAELSNRVELGNTLMSAFKSINRDGTITVGTLDLIDARTKTFPPCIRRIDGDLKLTNNKYMQYLNDNLQIKGRALLGKSMLRETPKNLSVSGDLYMHACPNFDLIQPGLVVGGSCTMSANVALTQLSSDMKIAKQLDLRNCTNFLSLPMEKIDIGRELYLNGCSSLRSLPNWISELGPCSYDRQVTRRIDISHTGLSEPILNNLRQQIALGRAEGIHFTFGQMYNHFEHLGSINAAVKHWFPEEYVQQVLTPDSWGLSEHDQGQLVIFLSALRVTEQGATNSNILRPSLLNFLYHIQKGDSAYTEAALDTIQEANTSCVDGVSFVFGEIEKMMIIQNALSSDTPKKEVLKIAKSFYAADLLSDYVRHKTKNQKFVDLVEVELGFITKLKEKLNLPYSIEKMHFIFDTKINKDVYRVSLIPTNQSGQPDQAFAAQPQTLNIMKTDEGFIFRFTERDGIEHIFSDITAAVDSELRTVLGSLAFDGQSISTMKSKVISDLITEAVGHNLGELGEVTNNILSKLSDPLEVQDYIDHWDVWRQASMIESAGQIKWDSLNNSVPLTDVLSKSICLLSSSSISDLSLKEPVIIAGEPDQAYDLSSLGRWISEHCVSPLTRNPVGLDDIRKVELISKN